MESMEIKEERHMAFQKTVVEGAYVISRNLLRDERGYFSRIYCEKEFMEAGINAKFVQMNLCWNEKEGTIRGLHYQKEKQEDKVVSCIKGKIFDVCVDIRKGSASYRKYIACELSEDNGKMLYIPKGCAHGYLTLADGCQLLYMMSEFYIQGMEGGYRYDDPAFHISWPVTRKVILSEKDQKLPYLEMNVGGEHCHG